jgi:UDP-N-acetylglucosamine 2-epimerase (non-hydrolysing)
MLQRLEKAGVRVVDPLGYIDFLALTIEAAAVLTDSGGIQEETTVLGVPCVTMRTTTERPITISEGTNRLVGLDPQAAADALKDALESPRTPRRPHLWDGKASERIVAVLMDNFIDSAH